MCLLERQLQKGRQGEIFYPLVHSRNVCKSQCWARQDLTSRSSRQVSRMGAGAPGSGPSFVALPRPLAGSWVRSGWAWTWAGTHVGCRYRRQSSVHCATRLPGCVFITRLHAFVRVFIVFSDNTARHIHVCVLALQCEIVCPYAWEVWSYYGKPGHGAGRNKGYRPWGHRNPWACMGLCSGSSGL